MSSYVGTVKLFTLLLRQ